MDKRFFNVQLVREMTEPDVDKRLKDAAEVERRLRALLSSEAATDDPGVDAPEPLTLYAAPSYEELELEKPSTSFEFGDAFRRERHRAWV